MQYYESMREGLFEILRPRQRKKLHILTHTAHATNQVGVELVLILVTGPHGTPVSADPT